MDEPAAEQLLFDPETRQRLLADVKVPTRRRQRRVLLDQDGTFVMSTDGVNPSPGIRLRGSFQTLGGASPQEAAPSAADMAGDSLTTSSAMAQVLISETLRRVASGADPLGLMKGLEKGTDAVLQHLEENASEATKEMIETATRVGDSEIGDLVEDVIERVGRDGVITFEKSGSMQTETELVEGMTFECGYISPYFATDSERMEAVIEDPYILITERKLSKASDILPWLKRLLQISKNLLIICEDCDGEALATLTVNKLRGTINAVAVQAPGFGDRRKDNLADIAALVGARVISNPLNRSFASVQISDMGRARRVIVGKERTTLVEGKGKKRAIDDRVKQIRSALETTTSDWDRGKLQERLAKMAGSVAVIKIAAGTEVELKEKKRRVEDVLSATRVTLEHGIVAGGGAALFRAVPALERLEREAAGEERAGIGALRVAIQEPLRRIVEGAQLDSKEVFANLRAALDPDLGFDAASKEYGNMKQRGIVDSLAAVSNAVENAVGMAGMMLTAQAATVKTGPLSQPK